MKHKFNQEEFEKIKALLNQGLPVKEVIKKSGWSEWTVYVTKKTNSFEEFTNYAKPKISNKSPIKNPPKTLQYEIITRFLQGTELEKFWENYKNHGKSQGGMGREAVLKQLITEEDLNILRVYTTKFDKTLKEYAKEENMNLATLYSRVFRIAVKVIAQHPEVLDQIRVDEQ